MHQPAMLLLSTLTLTILQPLTATALAFANPASTLSTLDTYNAADTAATASSDSITNLNLLNPAAAAAALRRSNLILPSSTLPLPQSGLTLKYVAIGLGTQNYTCGLAAPVNASYPTTSSTSTSTSTSPPTSTATPSLTPTPIGAIATLHDASRLLTSGRVPLDYAIQNLPCMSNSLNWGLNLPVLGKHYFSAVTGLPTFDLSPVGLFFQGKKAAGVPAPEGSCAGRSGAAAVDWLLLGDAGTGVSKGVSVVYRVETAGGKSLGCDGVAQGAVVVSDYAAEYWFYG